MRKVFSCVGLTLVDHSSVKVIHSPVGLPPPPQKNLTLFPLLNRKVEDLQFRVEEACITKGDLEVKAQHRATWLLNLKNKTLINAIISNQTANQKLHISIRSKSLQVCLMQLLSHWFKNLNSIIKLDTGAAVTLHPGSISDFQFTLTLFFIDDIFAYIRLSLLSLHEINWHLLSQSYSWVQQWQRICILSFVIISRSYPLCSLSRRICMDCLIQASSCIRAMSCQMHPMVR